jgi:uncharacterized protein
MRAISFGRLFGLHAPFGRRALFARGGLVAFALAAYACNRTEEPHSLIDVRETASAQAPSAPAPVPVPAPPAMPPPTAVTASAPTPAPPTEPERCVVPMPAEPLPRALPAPHCPLEPGTPPVMGEAKVAFPEAPKSPRITVEVANTAQAHEHGLMYRTKLAHDRGMLFSWPDERRRTFWMHNTCLPLDMLFIAADGTIAGILEQVPTLNDSPRAVPCPAAHVLEVNAGWSRAHGVKSGMKVRIE